MYVEQDDLRAGVTGDDAEELVGFAEGVVTGGHEDATLEVEDGESGFGDACGGGKRAGVVAEAGRGGGVVRGTDDAAATVVGVCGTDM